MKWREHIRLAEQIAETFDLEYFRSELVAGSIEPDQKRTVVHTWSKAKRTARRLLYRARRAFLENEMGRCARYLGIISHFIEDGMVHGTMDTFSHSAAHSILEGDIGARMEVSDFLKFDAGKEEYLDGEFVFREIGALVEEGLTSERLGRALSLLVGSVLSAPEAPEELIQSHRMFVERIRRPVFKVLGLAALAVSALGLFLFQDPFWLLFLPFCLLIGGGPKVFRFLARTGGALVIIAIMGAIYYISPFDWLRLGGRSVLSILLAGQTLYLAAVPDLSRLREKWYRLPPESPG